MPTTMSMESILHLAKYAETMRNLTIMLKCAEGVEKCVQQMQKQIPQVMKWGYSEVQIKKSLGTQETG